MHAHSGSRRDPDSTHSTRKDTWYCNCHYLLLPASGVPARLTDPGMAAVACLPQTRVRFFNT